METQQTILEQLEQLFGPTINTPGCNIGGIKGSNTPEYYGVFYAQRDGLSMRNTTLILMNTEYKSKLRETIIKVNLNDVNARRRDSVPYALDPNTGKLVVRDEFLCIPCSIERFNRNWISRVYFGNDVVAIFLGDALLFVITPSGVLYNYGAMYRGRQAVNERWC